MEKKNEVLIFAVVLLGILVLILGGYIIYDKLVVGSDKTTQTEENVDTNKQQEEVGDNQQVVDNSSSLLDFEITYVEEEYNAHNSANTLFLENKRNLPVITSEKHKDAADKIVNYLTDFSNTHWGYYKTDKINLEEIPAYSSHDVIGVTLTFSTTKLTEKFASFKFEIDGDLGGVGHDNASGFVFDINTGNKLDFSDICIEENSKNYFYNYVISELKAKNNTYTDGWENIVKEKMFDDWYLTDEGINFVFAKYSIGGGYLGVIIVEMPYSSANSYLKEEYRG